MTLAATESVQRLAISPMAGASWQQALKEAIRDPIELCRALRLSAEYESAAVRAAESFPVFAPREYVARMRPGDPRDPLLRQVLPLEDELIAHTGFTTDPVGDAQALVSPGLLHKYQARFLMVTTGACAVHCRYCFRRHYPYSTSPRSVEAWRPALDQIARDPTIHEVILSGGDPLTLVDPLLAELAEAISEIGHVRRLRVHTRLPIVIPQRVTGQLLAWLRATRLTPIMVVHANHPTELDASVRASLAELVDGGVPVLNQAVLLQGVNDDVEVLADLCEQLVNLRVLPYYLHQLDRVAGAAHFEVPEGEGRGLVEELRRRLPGYVREVAGAEHKVIL